MASMLRMPDSCAALRGETQKGRSADARTRRRSRRTDMTSLGLRKPLRGQTGTALPNLLIHPEASGATNRIGMSKAGPA